MVHCLLNEIHYTAKITGSRMPGGRLDPCLLMALDEIANIAPINVPNFMADAGGAWDNAKKVVETELRAKGTELHAATVVGDTVGDPFKDTSSVALNPIIKFTTLFGLLAVSLAVSLTRQQGAGLSRTLAAIFFVVALFFVHRSFYGMRIESGK